MKKVAGVAMRLLGVISAWPEHKCILHTGVVMVAAQRTRPRTRLDLPRRAAQRGKLQQFCSAVPRSVNEDGTTSLH